MAKENRLENYIAVHGSENLMIEWNAKGDRRKAITEAVGYFSNGVANTNGLYNELKKLQLLSGRVVKATTGSVTNTVKTVRRAVEPEIPQRVLFGVAAILEINVFERDEPIGYQEFKQALSLENGQAWLSVMLLKNMKAKERGEFDAWLSFNQEREAIAAETAKIAAEKAVWRPMVAAVKAAQTAGMMALANSVMAAMANAGYEFVGITDDFGNLIPTFE